MGSVPVNTGGGSGNKGLAELNHHLRYEHREVRDGVVGEGQGLSQEDESKINEVTEDVNVRRELAVQSQASLQKQPSGSVVRWERFLPLRSLKVLLVENDDCTRQVVSALLRNCSYEVVAVSNGVLAWKVLQDTTNHVDLILTEVVMPCVSGIGLLCKIMNHDTYKNIPVIMMSSHDSMGVVFKCLSKGAADFLVKPIRKNELKNLWQHVWRRCHSSSGSGSESGIQTRKSVKSKGINESENNTGSNDQEEEGSVGLNIRDGSDNGSGTQSSWTKRAVEVDSPRPSSPRKQLTAPKNSTCAPPIHPKFESFGKESMSTGAKNDCSDEQRLDNVPMGKDLEIGVPRNSESREGYRHEKVCTNLIDSVKTRMPELAPTEDKDLDYKPLQLDCQDASGELMAEQTDNADLTTNCNLAQVENGFSATPAGTKITEIKHTPNSDANEVPTLDLSLKRLRDISNTAQDDRNVLRRSDLSAFSRYNTSHNANQTPTAIVGSCSPLNNSSEAIKTDSIYNQGSNESSNNYDMSSTNKNVVANPTAFNDKSAATSTEKCLYPSTFQPVQNSQGCLSVQVIPQNANDAATNSTVAQPRGGQQQVQVQHHHHYYHHHHHHVHKMSQQKGPPENEDLSLSMGVSGLQCGSSNRIGGIVEGTTGNYSLNGSASGSNHGSSRQNGNNKDVNASGMNIESDTGVVGKSGVGGSGSGSGSGVDQDRSAQREAALTKFRQKRKERCFDRKVRYQSRKRLAEQRPRVRGQFVRQKINENAGEEAGC